MSLEAVYWREPLWFLGASLPGIAVIIMYARQRRAWHRLADLELLPWIRITTQPPRQAVARILIASGWLLLCAALAGPRVPHSIPPSLQRGDAAIVAIVDLSASMQARDERPHRIGRAQAVLGHWLNDAPASLRLGLVVFAGHAHDLLRPTADQDLVRHIVSQLPDLQLPTLGNNLAEALQLGAKMLADTKHDQHLVLFSDGDLDDAARSAAEAMARRLTSGRKVRLQVIGIGGNEAVSVPRTPTEPLVIEGRRIVSRRSTSWLGQFADQAGGVYQSVETMDHQPLAEVLDLPMPRIDPADNSQVLWDELFSIPLLAGMLCILLALQLGLSNRRTNRGVPSAMLAALLGGCQLTPGDGAGSGFHAALVSEDYSRARQLAAATTGYAARFTEGVACYRLKDYPCALQAFARAAWIAADQRQRGRAVFNLANTHFRLGDYTQASVLFNDAELLGIPAEQARLNREFADSLAASVQRRLADIAETERRAQWRAAAHDMPEDFDERIAEGIYLSRPDTEKGPLHKLSTADLNALVARGVGRLAGSSKDPSSAGTRRAWAKSPQEAPPEQTAGLFNRLLPMEIGLPTTPAEPFRIEGQRPW